MPTTPLISRFPPAAVVREFIDYDPETGVITWRHRARVWFVDDHSYSTWNTRFSGTTAGSTSSNGYWRITFWGHKCSAHRVVWLWMTGELPTDEIDHIDHNRQNNAWKNLRVVSKTDNRRNQTRRYANKSGVTGVHWDASKGKWRVQISRKYVGRFDSFDEAVAVRRAEEKAHGYHENHGGTR